MKRIFVLIGLALCLVNIDASADKVKKVTLKGQEDCPFAEYAEYGIFIPSAKKINAILVLQHGCGMEQFGITRNHDLQYQAFARKYGLLLIEPSIHGNCRVWGNPESGSAEALFKVLAMQAKEENHPEIEKVPLLLFGHSGGGYWTLGMLRDYPERILAAVCYSAAWDPQYEYKKEAAEVPVLLRHAGDGDGKTCPETAVNTCAILRAMDGLAAVALNEGENHNLSRMRHISIPFYEAAIKYRLPKDGPAKMRPVQHKYCWLGDPETKEIFPEKGYSGDKSKLCLFLDQEIALKWQEYVRTNDVADLTPPSKPYGLKALRLSATTVQLSWEAEADVESGIKNFVFCVNGKQVAQFPSDGSFYQNFDLNGDNTYPVMGARKEIVLNDVPAAAKISVQTVNQYGLASEKAIIKVKYK